MRRRPAFCTAVAVALGVLATTADAQDSGGPLLTLEEAITLALLDNPDVENAELDIDKTGEDIDAVRADYFPELTASLSTDRSLIEQSYTFDQGAMGTFPGIGPVPASTTEIETDDGWHVSAGLTVVQSLSGIYTVDLEVEKLTLQQLIDAEDLRSELQDTATAVKQQYYQIVATHSALGDTLAEIDMYRELEKEVADRVDQQLALQYELLDVQAQLASAEQQAQSQRNDIASQKEELNVLMGRDPATAFRVVEALVAPVVTIDPAEAREIALAQRPDLLAAQLKVDVAEKTVEITEYGYVPDIGLALKYSRSNSSFIPDESLYVGAYISWEFWDWGQRSSEIAADRIDVAKARNDVFNLRNKVIADVNSSVRDLEDAVAEVRVAEIAQQAAEEKLRVELNRYDQQVALLSDVLDAQDDLNEANDDYVDAVLQVLDAQAELAHAMGED